ncbi:hypothetical protein HMPREF9371_2268 [Neisseria shayeganii 871]|uniref:Uncharacterized protein n=1 Tax=Neisseria shayeganii 871 TaxID=1032488 RepID=G4CKX7_9NEIS|nr:hypothetical protein HMPREF9371_2268 [Neisseria shayeganii 871]
MDAAVLWCDCGRAAKNGGSAGIGAFSLPDRQNKRLPESRFLLSGSPMP